MITIRIGAIVALLFALQIALLHPALAQEPSARDAGAAGPTEAAQTEARTEMREGIAALDTRDYGTALRRFRRAMELVPEANLPHRYAAKALEALTRWDEAVLEYQEYLRIKADVSDAPAIRDRIDEIRRTYLTGTVVLHCNPEPTEISVDGSPVVVASELRLSKGAHRIVVAAPPSYVPVGIDVVVNPGTAVTPECRMERSAPAGPLVEPNAQPFRPVPETPPRSSPWYGRWYTWVGAGAVAGGILATILIVSASGTNPPPATEGGNHTFP